MIGVRARTPRGVPSREIEDLSRRRSVRLLPYGWGMRPNLIVIEARDASGETSSRRTYELSPGLSGEGEHAEVESLVTYAHPEAILCSTDPQRTYVEPGRTITVRPVVPPQSPMDRDQHRLFAI